MEEDDSNDMINNSFDSSEIDENKKSKKNKEMTDLPISPIKGTFGHKRNRSPPPKLLKHTPQKPSLFSGIKKPDQFQLTYSEKQLTAFNKNFDLLKNDFKILEEYEKTFFKDTTLDVMFIMDITGSMGMWLTEAKTNITNIITEITENNPCSKIRIGFVGYRDYTEDPTPVGQYVSLDFTDNVEEVKEFITKIEAYGGGDEPEDIAGAFEKVLNMKWESNARYAVLVCDAPCHGNKYHGVIYDKYSEGDPHGLVLENLVTEFVKKNITLYCVEINDSTQKMFNIMKEIYSESKDCEFHVETLGNSSNKFAFFVAFSASVTLGNITYNKVKLEDVINKFRSDTIETIIKKYNKNLNSSDNLSDVLINEIEGLDLNENEQKMFSFINRMSSLNINKEKSKSNILFEDQNDSNENDITIELTSSNIKFNHYYNAICHSLIGKCDSQLLSNWTNPLTVHRKLITQFNIDNVPSVTYNEQTKKYSLDIYDYTLNRKYNCYIPKVIPRRQYDNINAMINNELINYALVNQIGEYFNLRLIEYFPSQKMYIKFMDVLLYEVQDFPSKYLLADNKINEYSSLIANNLNKNVIEAFSHFSYQFSEGNLIITNLEYDTVKNLITNFKLSRIEDNGYGNVMKFFVSHYCNDIFKKLRLVHPRKKNNDFVLTNEFYYHYIISNAKLCELCRIPLYSKEDICTSCRDKQNRSMKKGICSECHNTFSYSCYYYNAKMLNYPAKCENCTFRF